MGKNYFPCYCDLMLVFKSVLITGVFFDFRFLLRQLLKSSMSFLMNKIISRESLQLLQQPEGLMVEKI